MRSSTHDVLSRRPGASPGFSLIELLIVLVIAAVLAGIAYPSYTAYTKRSQRAAARTELLRMQMAVERQKLITLGSQPTLPSNWVTTPTVAVHYQLSFLPGGAQTYTLEARAIAGDAQASDQQGDTHCAVLSLRVQGLETQYEPAACWQ